MKAKRVNMDRVERELAKTQRIVDDLLRQPVSVPRAVRRTEQNLARVKRNLAKSAKIHAELDRKLILLRLYMDRKHSSQRLTKPNENKSLHRRGGW